MNSSSDDYLKIINEILQSEEQQDYLEEDNEYYPLLTEPLKYKKSLQSKIKDLTSSSAEEISKYIPEFRGLKVDKFLIQIRNYHSFVLNTNNKKGIAELTIDLSLFEEKGSIFNKIDVHKDYRFKNQDWIVYFNTYKTGIDIPEEIVIQIIMWLQNIEYYKIFL